MKLLSSLVVIGALVAGPAYGACSYPKAPKKPPNGAKATLEEMLSGQEAVKQYDKDMNAYLSCLKLEHESTLAEKGDELTPEQIQKMERQQTKKHNAAVEQLEAVAARFNEELKEFKARKQKS